jgi:hypothetical protein
MADALASLGDRALGIIPERPRIAIKRGMRSIKEKRRLGHADAVVMGHPKSGSTWLRFQIAKLLQLQFGFDGKLIPKLEVLKTLDERIPFVHMAGFEYIKRFIAEPGAYAALRGKAVVFLLRNPLDVTVSMYMHVKKHALHERKLFNGWPLDLDNRTLFDFAANDPWGLQSVLNFYNDVARLHEQLGVGSHITTYERMRTDPAQNLEELARFFGWQMSGEKIREATSFASFENLRQAEAANTFSSKRLRPGNKDDPESFKVRRAKIGGYRDYFSPGEQELLLKRVTEELAPALQPLVIVGRESGPV